MQRLQKWKSHWTIDKSAQCKALEEEVQTLTIQRMREVTELNNQIKALQLEDEAIRERESRQSEGEQQDKLTESEKANKEIPASWVEDIEQRRENRLIERVDRNTQTTKEDGLGEDRANQEIKRWGKEVLDLKVKADKKEKQHEEKMQENDSQISSMTDIIAARDRKIESHKASKDKKYNTCRKSRWGERKKHSWSRK